MVMMAMMTMLDSCVLR